MAPCILARPRHLVRRPFTGPRWRLKLDAQFRSGRIQNRNVQNNEMKPIESRVPWFHVRPWTLAWVSDFRSSLRKQTVVVSLAVALYLLQLNRALAEDHVDYRYEDYRE